MPDSDPAGQKSPDLDPGYTKRNSLEKKKDISKETCLVTDLIETVKERFSLLFNAASHSPLRHKVKILLLESNQLRQWLSE